MSIISKGANAPLPHGPLRITVARTARPGSPAVAAAAVLLDATGRVRDGSDVVLGDRPVHPSGAVRYLGGAEEGGLLVQRLALDPHGVEPSVQRVLIAAVTAGGPFGAVDGLCAEVAGGDGAQVARYEVTDAGGETALVLGECYRRNGTWRFRAVGQGYAAGPEALAADFGIPVAALPAPPVPGPAPTEVHKGPEPAPPRAGTPPTAAVPVPPPVPGTGTPRPAPVSAPGAAPGAAGSRTGGADSRTGGAADRTDRAAEGTGGDAEVAYAPGEVLHEWQGNGDSVLTLDRSAPRGPLLVEASSAGGFFVVQTLDRRNEEDELLFNAVVPLRNGRALVVHGNDAVRLRIETDGAWTLRVLPVTAARPLTPDAPVSASGPDVLLHDGPIGDLRIRHRGRNAVFCVTTARPDRPDESDRDLLTSTAEPGDTTHPLPAGPLLVLVEAEAPWTATLLPVAGHHRTPEEAEQARVRSRATGVYEGRGPTDVVLENPEPDRPAVLEYEALGTGDGPRDFLADWIDGEGVETPATTERPHGSRGRILMFTRRGPRARLRVKTEGEWRLRVCSPDTIPSLTDRAEGRGAAVLHYAGPPALLRIEHTGPEKRQSLEVLTAQPGGLLVHLVAQAGPRRTATGPLAGSPDGWVHVVVSAPETVGWRLAVLPLDSAPELERKVSGKGPAVVRMAGPPAKVDVRHDNGKGFRYVFLFTLDEYLRPVERLCIEPGVCAVPTGWVTVRAQGKWSLQVRG
ncbi:TerD family protein [Streptomyces sp. NPDC089799]|uniref:TerD family protein n=1 Tax=Streptomyces sp. NPDC089799 TaxID=3155066 RepID=UPI00341EEAE9